MAASAEAQTLRGWAQVQYQNLDRAAPVEAQEWWLTSFQVDYATRIRQTTELFSQIQFNELNFSGRPDRSRRPRGTIRLAHSLFGLFASYRPDLVTDSRNVTTEQQELMLSGYVQKTRLPRLDGSWIRRHQKANAYLPAATSEIRTLSANHDAGPFNFRAGYGDRSRETEDSGRARISVAHYNLGWSLQLRRRRANALLSYDFTRTRRKTADARSQSTQVHNAALNGGSQLSQKSSVTAVYNFRHSNIGQPGAPAISEHDGALTLEHRATKIVRVSGGGGVRSATDAGRQDIESYVLATASADGEARPGLRLGAGVSHSWSWLPHDKARPIESFRSNAQMRLARGLDVTGDLQATASRRRVARTDTTTSPTQVVLQTGAGVRATPLRAIALSASARRYRSGASLGGEAVSANSYVVDVRWYPTSAFQLGGNWGRSGSLGATEPDRTIVQGDVQWTPTRFLQANGTYTHSDRPGQGVTPGTQLAGGEDVYGGRLVAALTRDLRTTIQYSEADPGRASHSRQVNVTVTQSFRR